MSDTDRNADNDPGNRGDIRQKAIQAYDASLGSAGRSAGETIEEAPLIALGAGIAAGALLAALLPSSRREREFLRPYGSRVTGAARDAADAAKKAGSEKLRELGLTPDALTGKASEAAKATAEAVVGTLNESRKR